MFRNFHGFTGKNCIRFLKAGLLLKVLNVFRHWVHWKGKGLLKLSRAVINIYAHIARTSTYSQSSHLSVGISLK